MHFGKKAPMQKNRAKKLVEMAIIFLADVKFLTIGETECEAMQIQPSGSHPYVMRKQPETTSPPRMSGIDPIGEVPTPVPSGQVSYSQQFSQLLLALQQLPDIRAEVIEAIAERLAQGELESPQAAAETAHALLQHTPAPTPS